MHYSDLDSINGRIFNRTEVSLGEAELREVEACYRFLEDFEQGKVIYGINTGFGPMAQYRIGDADLNSLQYNIIRSHSCGAGETLPDICVRAAMLARLQTFLNAKSGVHPDVVRILADFLNNEIYPLVPRHGSVGASGDLVQLAHIALALIGESEVSFRGETVSAAEAMKACGITPLRLRIRDGLALTNGTAVMTGIGMVNLAQARRLLDWAVKASVMLNEVVESYDDFMAEPLNACKLHAGQIEITRRMREICASSRRLRKRETELYNGDTGEAPTFKHKVQPYYSLRCTPQILGPVLETLEQAEKILVEEFNSVDDNPVVDSKTGTIYHGGNFHGDYVSLEMDKLKIAVTKMTMLAERQLHQRNAAAVREPRQAGAQLRPAGGAVHGDLDHGRIADAFESDVRALDTQQQRQSGYRQHGHQRRDADPSGDRKRLSGAGDRDARAGAGRGLSGVRRRTVGPDPAAVRRHPPHRTQVHRRHAQIPGDRSHRKLPQTASMTEPTKYALVTGGSRGIGREICLKLARSGYYVLINYRSNADEAQRTLEGVRAAGGDGETLRFDVAAGEETAAAIAAWQERHKGAVIEVVVNNAGIRSDTLMMWMEPQQWHSVVDTGLGGFYNVTRPLLKDMLVKRFGRIVNIVSLSGIKGLPGQTNYSAAKGGVIAATKALAQEVAKKGVTVNAIAPGFVRTDMTADLDEAELKKQIPAGRFCEAEEVADLAMFLISDKASYITGEVISINGGLYT